MRRRALFLPALLSIAAYLGSAAAAETVSVSGTVTYLERIAPRPGMVLEVELLDISRADAPSRRLASRRYALDRVPFPFTLTADAALIDDRMSYSVTARILQEDRVVYRSTRVTPVLTRGAPSRVDIVVSRTAAAAGLPVGSWVVTEISGRVVVDDEPPRLTVAEDGTRSVYAGCNTFSARVPDSGGEGLFPPNMAGTLMACPEPRERMERDMLAALAQVSGHVESDAGLALTNAAGLAVLRLRRAE